MQTIVGFPLFHVVIFDSLLYIYDLKYWAGNKNVVWIIVSLVLLIMYESMLNYGAMPMMSSPNIGHGCLCISYMIVLKWNYLVLMSFQVWVSMITFHLLGSWVYFGSFLCFNIIIWSKHCYAMTHQLVICTKSRPSTSTGWKWFVKPKNWEEKLQWL